MHKIDSHKIETSLVRELPAFPIQSFLVLRRKKPKDPKRKTMLLFKVNTKLNYDVSNWSPKKKKVKIEVYPQR